jgi:bifunctional ADP-heptose synthase (sugar kinase/adenylyltransferase)
MPDRASENRRNGRDTHIPADLVSELLMGMRLVGIDYRRIEITSAFRVRSAGGRAGAIPFHRRARVCVAAKSSAP